jgi:Family of unknown function (DUF5808)
MTKHEQPSTPRRTGKLAGLPFDLRRPTTERFEQRAWNPNDARFFTPKTVGWGYGVNLYWIAHPAKYVKGKRAG